LFYRPIAQNALMDAPMKARLLSVLLAALIAGVAVYSPSAESQIGSRAKSDQAEPEQIDFMTLHSQAANAMQSLQSAQDRRVASQDTAATF
jgi:hypothetical protein